MYNSVVFSIIAESCSQHHSQFQNILATPKGNPVLLNSHSPFPRFPALGNQSTAFHLSGFTYLGHFILMESCSIHKGFLFSIASPTLVISCLSVSSCKMDFLTKKSVVWVLEDNVERN